MADAESAVVEDAGADEYELVTPAEKEQTEVVHHSAVAVIAAARALEIRNVQEAAHAAEVLERINGERRRAEAARTALVRPLNRHVRFINAGFKPAAELLNEADGIVRGKMMAYDREQDQIRAEAQARLEAEAEKLRLADQAEHARKEAEARELREAWEAEARERSAAAAADATPDAISSAASATEAAERMAVLEHARREAMLPERVVPVIAPPPPVSKGVVRKKRWTFEVVDPSLVPREFLLVDEKAIRAAMNEGLRELAGVRFFQRDELAVRPR